MNVDLTEQTEHYKPSSSPVRLIGYYFTSPCTKFYVTKLFRRNVDAPNMIDKYVQEVEMIGCLSPTTIQAWS